MRFAYVNGAYRRYRDAVVHIDDRGYLFADGVYEVIAAYRGRLVDESAHLARLDRSLAELHIGWPVARRALPVIIRRTLSLNGVATGIVYVQVTRGVAPRDHGFPSVVAPTLVVTARHHPLQDRAKAEAGVAVTTVPDLRWTRCDIKSIALLPNVLGKQAAREGGAYEAWQVGADGAVTEGTSSNAWIVDTGGHLVTHPDGPAILGGITRRVILDLAAAAGIPVELRPFTIAEAQGAQEAFLTSTTSFVMPVISIDGYRIADGRPGPLTRRLQQAYLERLNLQDPP